MIRLVAVAAVCLSLAGCSEYVAKGLDFLNTVNAGLITARGHIQDACAEIGRHEAAAEASAVNIGGACSKWHAAAVRTRKGVEAVCNRLPMLTDDVVGNYVVTVRNQLKGLQGSKPAGC